MVVPTFVRQALAGEPITVFGTGEQRRCFCHVKDVVRALVDLCQREDLYGEVLNIGSTEEVSMLELAERVKVVTGSESEIVLVPYEEAYGEGFEDMHRRVPDISKIEADSRLAPDRVAGRDPPRRGRARAVAQPALAPWGIAGAARSQTSQKFWNGRNHVKVHSESYALPAQRRTAGRSPPAARRPRRRPPPRCPRDTSPPRPRCSGGRSPLVASARLWQFQYGRTALYGNTTAVQVIPSGRGTSASRR